MRIKGWQAALSAVCILLGVLLTIQINTQRMLKVSLPTHRASDLAVMLREQQKTLQALETEIAQVRKEREHTNTQAEIRKLRSLLGLTPVEGPGVKVVLSDLPSPNGSSNPDDTVDFIQISTVINELWSAGAEAVSLNGKRVITTTGVTLADDQIMLGKDKISSPYIFLATGSPATLESALRMRNGAVDMIKVYGLGVTISQESKLVIPAFSHSLQYTYMVPMDQTERR
jgi:uncharacterized protein YlxW (UPF0749 family)